jgi:hypothetical protein
MAVMNVQDMNGKDFSFDSDKIVRFNGDLTDSQGNIITDGKRQRVLTTHDVQCVDSNGNILDATQIVNDMKSGKSKISAIDVEAESTHSGKNHNYCIYYEDSMEKDAESFTNPFRKPMLKNHNDYSGEPLGRIRQAWHGPSKLTDERSAIHTVTRVTDADAIEKFLDGRYQTLSIGGTMGTVTCNICGKTILKDGKFKFCGHWKGETYKDQVCYWGVRDIDYNEHSVVNNPADDFAQVMKITVLTDNDKKKEGVGDNMDGKNNPTSTQTTTDNQTTPAPAVNDSVDKREQLLSIIDAIIAEKTNTAQDAQGEQTPDTPVAPDTANDGVDTPTEKTVEDYKKKLEEANQKIADMEAKVAEAEQKVTDAEAAKEQAVQDATNMKQQAVQLAEEVKSLMADSIIALENVEDSKVEERKAELVAMSMKDLQAAKDSIKTETSAQPRVPAKAQNPTKPNANEKGSVVVDANGEQVKKPETKVEDSNKKSSVQDYADEIIKKLARR